MRSLSHTATHDQWESNTRPFDLWFTALSTWNSCVEQDREGCMSYLTLTVPVTAIDALRHFETG